MRGCIRAWRTAGAGLQSSFSATGARSAGRGPNDRSQPTFLRNRHLLDGQPRQTDGPPDRTLGRPTRRRAGAPAADCSPRSESSVVRTLEISAYWISTVCTRQTIRSGAGMRGRDRSDVARTFAADVKVDHVRRRIPLWIGCWHRSMRWAATPTPCHRLDSPAMSSMSGRCILPCVEVRSMLALFRRIHRHPRNPRLEPCDVPTFRAARRKNWMPEH